MSIRNLPVTVSEYYNHFIRVNSEKLKTAKENKDKISSSLSGHKEYILDHLSEYEMYCQVHVDKLDEFINAEYKNGELEKIAKNNYIKASNNGDDKMLVPLFKLFEYSKCLKQIVKFDKQIKLLEKLVNLTYTQYAAYLYTYYSKVHEKLILEGVGYVFAHDIGWICYNRVIFHETGISKRRLDYAATKKAKQALIDKGLTPYDKKTAEWCKERGIEYNGIDYKVYQTDEAFYELAYMPGKLPNFKLKYHFTASKYRGTDFRGKTIKELSDICNGDINKVFELRVDLRTKFVLALQIKPNLYLNYIRNENQESVVRSALSRKNRQ